VTDEQILNAAAQTKQASSPGFQLGFLSASKGKLLEDHDEFLIEVVRERLDALQAIDLTAMDLKPMELYERGLTDPIRMFVKNEPHSEEKIKAGRLRLIASVSMADEIIERLLCGAQNEAEISQWETCPSKPGIGFSDAQTEKFVKSVKGKFKADMAEADVSAWDWSVQEWMLAEEAELRIKLCDAPKGSAFARILRNRIYCLSRSVLVTSDGVVFEQTEYGYGIMKSGSYLTSSSNSRMRNFCAHLVGADDSDAMGDDSLETWVAEAIARYKALGIKVKFYKIVNGKFEFCSNEYDLSRDPPVAVPKNWHKGLFRLLSASATYELLVQFLHEYRHLPSLAEVKTLILESGWISKANKTDDFQEQEEVARVEAPSQGGRSAHGPPL